MLFSMYPAEQYSVKEKEEGEGEESEAERGGEEG